MHAALRPYATAGIALVGASVIAVTPIAPPPPDIRTASPAVQLTGVYTQLVQDTLQNAGVLVRVYFAEPFPIIQAIVGLNVTAPTDIPTALRDVGNAVVEAVLGGLVSTGLALYAFVQAVATFNPIEVFRVVFVAPGLIAGAVLNGLPFPFPSVGILNPGQLGEPFGLSGWPPSDRPGLVGALIELDQAIGAAISELWPRRLSPSTPLTPVNEPPTPGATTLTLNTGSALDSGATSADQELGKVGSEAATPAQQGLATAAAGAANAAEGLATANASEQAEQGLANAAPEGFSATERLATAEANASDHADEGVGAARAAATAERPGGATDLTDGKR